MSLSFLEKSEKGVMDLCGQVGSLSHHGTEPYIQSEVDKGNCRWDPSFEGIGRNMEGIKTKEGF